MSERDEYQREYIRDSLDGLWEVQTRQAVAQERLAAAAEDQARALWHLVRTTGALTAYREDVPITAEQIAGHSIIAAGNALYGPPDRPAAGDGGRDEGAG